MAACCTGVFSSRRIQKRLQEDIPFKVLAWSSRCSGRSRIAALKSRVPAQAIQVLGEDLDRIAALLSKQSLKGMRVLFIGDCIQFETMSALLGPCVRAQISIKPTFIPERVQPVVRNRIRAFSSDEFDLDRK